MNEAELIDRILALSPEQVKALSTHLNKPLNRTKIPRSSKVEEVRRNEPWQECGNCQRMTVRQSSEDYHVLENSCSFLKSREFDYERKRWNCKGWHARRRTAMVTEGAENEPTDEE